MSYGATRVAKGLVPSATYGSEDDASLAALAGALADQVDWLVLRSVPTPAGGVWLPIFQATVGQDLVAPTPNAWEEVWTVTLAQTKAAKHEAIDSRTEELIGSGFAHAGKAFSTSDHAQSKWHAIFNMNQIGQIAFPLAISAQDESSYSIADAADLNTMYVTMVGTGKYHHDTGKALKDAIALITNDGGQPDVPPNYHNEADAIAAVEAIEDAR